jgi:hypothetical protein
VTDSPEHGNEPQDSVGEDEFLDCLSDYYCLDVPVNMSIYVASEYLYVFLFLNSW